MNSVLVSVGLPVVKPDFLKLSIDSCLTQSHKNIEVIIINNAKDILTKNEIRLIVEEYNDKRIKYIENDFQLEMVENWNLSLRLSNGEFFALLCDDDLWEPLFLESLVNLSFKFPCTNIFHCRTAKINSNGCVNSLTSTCPEFEEGIDFILHRLLGFRTIYLSDFLVKRKPLMVMGGFLDFPSGWGSDVFTWFKLSLNGGIGYSDEVLFNYRESSINVSNSADSKKKQEAIIMHINILNEIKDNYKFGIGKYDVIKEKVFLNELNRYQERGFTFIYYKILINKYKLPEKVAYLLSYFPQVFKSFFA